MTRRRSLLGQAEHDTYKANRLLRTVQAARRGPVPLAKHYARRAAYRAAGRLLRSITR